MSGLFVTVESRLEIPILPNFIRTQTGESILLRDLTPAQLEAIGKVWVEELLKKAQRSREARKPPPPGMLEVVT